MKKQTVLGVLLLFVMFCFNAKAEVITVEGASEIANAFFTQSARSQKTQLKSATQLEYAWDSNSLTQSGSSMLKSVEEDPTFYVFNNPDGEGFVIVSGDSNTRSIIGYSYEGNAPAVTDIPLPMQDYLSGIDAEVKYARENITTGNKNLKATEAETGGNVVKHLETAKWGQSTPFNNLCPVVQVYDSNNNIIETSTLTGCVPTAFSIVMRYHEWPIQGKGSIVASWTVDQYNGYNATNYPVVTIDHTATTYDWDNMPLEYSANWTQENITQVATLMRNVGYAFGVTYTPGNTYVSDGNLPDKIKTCFDYTIETTALGNYEVSGSINDISEWKNKLKSSLGNDCPIPYAATNSGTGDSRHMFVVDGYTDNDYFHFNFGWNGNGNGWFTIDAITPSTGDNYSWTDSGSEHRAYINFKPNKEVTISVNVDPSEAGTITIDGESVASKVVEAGSTVTLQATGDNFYGWLVNGEVVSTENPYSATINSGITYTAKFATSADLYLQAALVSEGGNYELDEVNKPTASTYTITEGVSIELNANTQRGYSFLGWYDAEENLIDSETPTTINITSQIFADPYIFAKYSQLSPITTTSFVTSADAGMGTVSCKFNGNPVSEVYEGESVTLTASPIDASYIFKNWTLNGADIQGGAEITVSVVAGQSYVANFIATSELADITVNMNKGGTVSINGGSASSQAKVTDVQVGSYITIQAHPVSPNEFLYWVDYSDETSILSEENPWNFQVTGTARYKAIMGEPLVVTATSAGTGGTAIAYPTKVLSGKTTTLTATPTQGYEFVNWTLNGVEVSTENPYTATITESAEYVANFRQTGSVTPTQYTVIVSASPAEGGTAKVNNEQSVTVESGTNVTITATPADGYEFVEWQVNGVSSPILGQNDSFGVTASNTFVAIFRQTEQGGGEEEVATKLDRTGWTVTASSEEASGEGTGNGVPSCIVDESLTTYWHSKWQGGEETYPHWFKIDMKSVKSIEAFDYVSRGNTTADQGPNNGNILNYKLYVSDTDIDVNSLPDPVKTGTFEYASSGDITSKTHNVELETPVVGRYIMLYATGNSANNRQNASCVDFQVYGKPAYTVSATASPTEGGSASVSANVIGSGESVTFTASPNTGYNFIGWYNGEDKESESLEYTATVTSDLSLTAKFAKQTFTVSAAPEGTNGTVTVSPNGTVEYETQVTFTATANPGYRFVQWSNGETDNPYVTTITANTELTASFELIPTYTVNVTTNGTGGTATASSNSVEENGTVTLTAEPKDGYRFTGWYQNEELVSTSNPYTIQSVTGNIDYVANFVESSDELLLTFACLSDLHAQQDFITDANNIRLRESATKTLAKIKEQENVDLIVLGGDYTSNNTISQTSWETTRSLLIDATRGAFNGDKTPVIYVNGNHEYEVANYDAIPKSYNAGEYYGTPMKTDIGALAAEDCFYETASNGTGEAFELLAAYHYVVNGFDFVVLNTGKNFFTSASDYSYSIESVQWCTSKLAQIYATDKNKTVFFLVHIPFSDSKGISNVNKGMNKGADANFISALKTSLSQYPNLIMLYGHDHGTDSAYIRTSTSERVTEYATNGDVYTGEGSASSLYYIQNYNTNKYLGYNSYNLATTDTQSSDVTITTSTVTDGAFVFDLSTTLTNNVGTIRYLHCGGSGRFSGNNENGATNQQIKVFKVEDPSATTLTATQVTEITSGGTYMLVASNDGTNYYALTNEITYNTENDNSSQRMVGAAVTITDGTITYAPGTASVLWNIVKKPSATDKSFISSFMGSMRYYENSFESGQIDERRIVQALMVYVYSDRVELKMKNYGDEHEQGNVTANGITINQDLKPYVSYRTVTHSAEAVTATPTITSTGDDVNAKTEVTVTVDAPEWHNLYYTINGDTPTESSDKVENGQITFTATEGEYVVKVVAQEGIRLVSPVAEVTYRVVDTHGITVSATEGGTADFSINEGEGTVTLTATEPTEGYKFVGWSVGESAEIVSEDLTYTISIVENAAYKANYAKRTYTVTVSTNNEEWGTVNTIANPVTHGETVTLTATPAEGYRFVNWTVSGNQVSTSAEYTTEPVTANVEYIANFQLSVQPEKLTITEANIAGMNHYTFDGGYPVSKAIDGDRNTLFMSAAGPGVDAAFTITLRKLSNVYEIKQYYDPSSNDLPQNAVIEISTDNQQWKKVADVNTSVINDNKEFSCNAGGAEAKYIRIRFLASQDPWFRLNEFEAYGVEIIQYFAVSASTNNRAMGKATMSVAGPTVEEGASVTFTATPYSGYRFVNWTNEGNEVSTDNPYTIQSVTDNINYVANFEKLPTYTVTARSNNEAMGVVTPSSSQVIYGNTATIKAVAKPNYRFVNWTKGSDVVSTNATFTTPMITADAEYIANFEAMPTEAEKISIVDASTNFATYQSYVIGNIKDGNYSTLFWSEGAQEIDKYVMVDLGALYNVEDIKFYFDSGDKPYGAVVEISTDNSTWTEVSTFVTTDLGADNTYVCDAEKKTAQYIRMRINVAGTNWLKLKEFEVYGLKTTTSSADITKTTATEDATVEVTTDAPATIKVGNTTYTTTAENLTATITLNVTSAETVTIESIGANITSIDCGENAVPTELPTTITEVELRNVNAGEVEIEAPLLEKITIVSDDDDNVATVATTSDLSQGVQVVVEKEIKTPKTLGDGTTPTIFNFLSMPFAFNTAGIKYWDGDSWETAEPENHVRILLYDSQKRANQDYKNTWEKITTSTHKTIAANQGFVIVGNNDLGTTVKLQFTSEVAAYDGSVTSVIANRYRKDTGETNGQDGDWNLNGVPYLTAGEFAEDYTLYTYDNNTLGYVSHTPASGLPTLKPYQSVMYQAEIAGEEMTKEIAINSASISNANASENVYARAYISIDDSTPAKIILSDETSENFVVNEDAWYMPSLINTTPAAYFNVGGAEASVSVQPAANELPMTVYTGAGTSHRISLTATDGNYNVYLKDAATDETVCLNDEDYTFTATAKITIADRFTVSMLEPTGIIDAARAEGAIKPVVLSNAIKLYGTEEGDQVSLYTANGMIITNAVTEEGVTTIPTSVTGVIIIKVAGETVKVVK